MRLPLDHYEKMQACLNNEDKWAEVMEIQNSVLTDVIIEGETPWGDAYERLKSMGEEMIAEQFFKEGAINELMFQKMFDQTD